MLQAAVYLQQQLQKIESHNQKEKKNMFFLIGEKNDKERDRHRQTEGGRECILPELN